MRTIRSKHTKPELRVRSFFHRMGFRFRLHVKALPGTPDLVLKKYKTVIFVHGCFWHQHKGCKNSHLPESNRNYWEPKLINNVTRDNLARSELVNLGWEVVELWECELDEHRLSVVASQITQKHASTHQKLAKKQTQRDC